MKLLKELLALREYNRGGGLGDPFTVEKLRGFLKNADKVLTHIATVKGRVISDWYILRHDMGPRDRIYIIKSRRGEDIAGYVTLKKVTDDVWQEQEVHVFPEFQGLRLTTELYTRLVLVAGLKIINSNLLSVPIEKIWKALVRDGQVKKVYDLKLHQSYPLVDVGTAAPDGTTILSPEEDKVEKQNIADVRFFYLAETTRLMREWYREDDPELEKQYHCWLREEEYPGMRTRSGFMTQWCSEEGDE